jgi:multidrug transporter EmrE-like cation transporter
MSLFLLLSAFVLTGLNLISNKAIHPLGLDAYMGLYGLGFWGTGVVLGLVTQTLTRHRSGSVEARVGLAMGASGSIAMVLLLVALKTVPGVVAFPVRSIGNTTMTAIVSYLAWKERLTPRQLLGIICGLAAIYLLLPTH